jgi:hypothetical protein
MSTDVTMDAGVDAGMHLLYQSGLRLYPLWLISITDPLHRGVRLLMELAKGAEMERYSGLLVNMDVDMVVAAVVAVAVVLLLVHICQFRSIACRILKGL